MSSYFWESTIDELDNVEGKNNFLRAKVASGGYWAYLSQARSEAEFEGRLDLSIERIASVVPEGQLSPVVASLREDFKSLLGERIAAREAALQATAEALAAKALPIPHVHVTKHSGFFQVDHVASNTLQNNIHRGDDEGAAMNEARKFGQYNNMPVFVNGQPDNEPLEKESSISNSPGTPDDGKGPSPKHYDEGFEHGSAGEDRKSYAGSAKAISYGMGYKDGQSGGKADKPKRQVVKRKESTLKTAEFFNQETQRWERISYIDPSDAQRYNHYPNYNDPVDNGDLQGPDGFPVDLAQGEQRTPDAYARQLTPGQWDATPNWTQNDMNLQPGPGGSGTGAGWATHSPQRTATVDGGEGIVPKPGQNPHYFEPGNNLQSDGSGFPVDVSLDEEADNRVNEYGGVPPVKSGGSNEGVNGPYSQNLNATAGWGDDAMEDREMQPHQYQRMMHDNGAQHGSEGTRPAHPDDEHYMRGYNSARTGSKTAVQYGPHFNPAHATNVLVYHTGYTHGQEGRGFKQLSKNDHAKSYALGYAHGTDDQGISATASMPQFFDPTVAGKHDVSKDRQEGFDTAVNGNYLEDDDIKNDGHSEYGKGLNEGVQRRNREQWMKDNNAHPVVRHRAEAGRHEKMPEWMGSADLFEEGQSHAEQGMEPQRNHPDYFRGYQVGMNNRKDMYATAADYKSRPSLANPNGSGDDYTNKTWDAQTQQRPLQDSDARGANTPTLPQEDIKMVDTNNPGASRRDEEDED